MVSFWTSPSFWEGAEYASEMIVFLGAAVETLAEFEIILKGDSNASLRKHVEKLSAIALVIGLATGLLSLYRTNKLFNDRIADLYTQSRNAYDRAATAETSAGTATKEAGAANERAAKLALDLESEKQKTVRFQKDADIARLELEKQIREQGPRWAMLEGVARRGIEERLKPFKGQLAFIVACENNPYTAEHEQTIGDIVGILHNAEWNASSPSYQRCVGVSTHGLMVYVHKLADAKTALAADAIADALLPRINSEPLFRRALHEDFRLLNMPDGSVLAPPPWTIAMLSEHFRDAVLVFIPRHP